MTNTFGAPIPIATKTLPYGLVIGHKGKTAYVVANLTNNAGAVIPLDLSTNGLGTPILAPSGTTLVDLAITPDDKTAYLAVYSTAGGAINAVIPIDLVKQKLGTPIPSPPDTYPVSIAITPDGKTAYVANASSFTDTAGVVIPIDLFTNVPGPQIRSKTGSDLSNSTFRASFVVVAPDGKTAYVGAQSQGHSTSLVPLDLTGPTPKIKEIKPINRPAGLLVIGGSVNAIAITPDSQTAYLAVSQHPQASGRAPDFPYLVIPVDLATMSLGTPIFLNSTALAIEVTP
jgi:DNA-binding beta-propeller fold protein YncE